MDRQLEMLSESTSLYVSAAERVAKYIHNGEDHREQQLAVLRRLVLDNIRRAEEAKMKAQVLDKLREQMTKIPDLQIEEVRQPNE